MKGGNQNAYYQPIDQTGPSGQSQEIESAATQHRFQQPQEALYKSSQSTKARCLCPRRDFDTEETEFRFAEICPCPVIKRWRSERVYSRHWPQTARTQCCSDSWRTCERPTWCSLSHYPRDIDTTAVQDRKQGRSKYGAKRPAPAKISRSDKVVSYNNILKGGDALCLAKQELSKGMFYGSDLQLKTSYQVDQQHHDPRQEKPCAKHTI